MRSNILRHTDKVTRNNHKGVVLWFTGLSGAGKSTLASRLQVELLQLKKQVYILDGDKIRRGLSKDLSFTVSDRIENMRRVAECANLFLDAGFIVIVSLISPYEQGRKIVQEILSNAYHLIYIRSSLDICKKRDVKGLYKKALFNEIENFTGISDQYQIPNSPSLVVDTTNNNSPYALSIFLNLKSSFMAA